MDDDDDDDDVVGLNFFYKKWNVPLLVTDSDYLFPI
jgi:hypothetical protein